MPRKLQVYQTSQGFYDLAIAAPSMKAALEAWGANNNLFHQGFARESNDSKVIAAAMERPGIVLRRPVGSDVAFREHADLPSAASLEAPVRLGKERPAKASEAQKVDANADRQAAAAFEKERQRRERQRQKEEARAAKARARREAERKKAETELEVAAREHDKKIAVIEHDLAAVQRLADAEQKRWEKLKERLETALRKAGR
jgi:colicin import membrane protein